MRGTSSRKWLANSGERKLVRLKGRGQHEIRTPTFENEEADLLQRHTQD